MNSYQTVNAAYAAAGLSKQSAVNFGRAVEGHPYSVSDTLPLFRELAGRDFGKLITHGLVYGRARQIDQAMLDIETIPARVSGFKSAGFADRVAADKARRRQPGLWNDEDKARQLRVAASIPALSSPYGRDQSEDRQAPRYIVGYEVYSHGDGAWKVWDTHNWRDPAYTWSFSKAQSATEWAVQMEASFL